MPITVNPYQQTNSVNLIKYPEESHNLNIVTKQLVHEIRAWIV